jgi:hypothetical protein
LTFKDTRFNFGNMNRGDSITKPFYRAAGAHAGVYNKKAMESVFRNSLGLEVMVTEGKKLSGVCTVDIKVFNPNLVKEQGMIKSVLMAVESDPRVSCEYTRVAQDTLRFEFVCSRGFALWFE